MSTHFTAAAMSLSPALRHFHAGYGSRLRLASSAMPDYLWTVRHLIFLLVALCGAVIAALLWGSILRRRMSVQTDILRKTMEEEAARERHQAFVERQRSRVLEAINSSMPLDQVLRMITNFISEQSSGLCCWCVAHTGMVIASENARGVDMPTDRNAHIRRDIHTPGGDMLGVFLVDCAHAAGSSMVNHELLDLGVSLAALAIDNRRLYADLVHRSEYDQLTDIPNRFLLESRIAEALASAQRHGQMFAMIYIDLDHFKKVNDRYGHRAGDIYLQKVARRLAERLRSRDTLARVGGDEFIALIPLVRDRCEAEDIGRRLEEGFHFPFDVDGLIMHGSASIGVAVYPEDGEDTHELKLVADAAMYSCKQRNERLVRHGSDFSA